jgi:hypothetical protein
VIVVPSPVHYDRAGRRVIDPSWQETMYQMIQAEQETPEAAAPEAPAGGEPAPQEERIAGADQEKVRETVILIPGPALRRIRGTLTVAKGMLALEDAEGVLWYLPGLDRYIGFIDGLDAGEEAALEGYAPSRGSSQERYFQATRLFLDEMDYDLAIPPEGLYLSGQTTIIREIERRGGAASWDNAEEPGKVQTGNRAGPGRTDRKAGPGDRYIDDPDDEDDAPAVPARRPGKPPAAPPAQPGWQHKHKSPWAPPSSVMDFKMDYDSFWQAQDDAARQERRERDSRELWY